ncbi:MAG TPA: magnesium transporter [Candidatus Acidoferrales bacterium]|jgi:magnesium transporter|nr:magnesium transporter [Candidatus Acidoferrales bacterium]
MAEKHFTLSELYEAWPILSIDERVEGFEFLPRNDADDFFLQLSARDRAELILALPPGERRLWMRLLAPDDAADVIQEAPQEERESLLALLDDSTRREVKGLLDYAEDDAGGLMNTRYSRLRADMTVGEAISYLRRDARAREKTVYYAYVVDPEERLLGVVTFRDLIVAPGDKLVKEVMRTEVISAPEDLDQEALSQLFMRHHLMMVPVVDAEGRIKGIVSVDDIVHVVQEEATEDIQKIGGVETLEGPYLQIPLLKMIQKRAGWLAALFLGEMLTATAMGQFEAEIARAVVLALFVPLIISSGGNSGSQATTLVIRAMALGEVRLRDWWRVIRREFVTGLGLGTILAAIGLTRILLWQGLFNVYGDHYFLLAMTVALSLIGVVMWGSLIGSILPFILRGLGFDPASASAPFVATLVDVTGLVIYFSVAAMVLRGTLL